MTTVLTIALIAVFILVLKTRSELKNLRMLTETEASVIWDTLLLNNIIDGKDYEIATNKALDLMRQKEDPEKYRKESAKERAEMIKKYQLDKPIESRT